MPQPDTKVLDKDVARAIGQRLQELMEERDWNQSETARRVGCRQGTISDLIHPKKHRIPSGHYILRIIKTFGCSAHWFLFGTGPKYLQAGGEVPSKSYVRGALSTLARVDSALSVIRNDVLREEALAQRGETAIPGAVGVGDALLAEEMHQEGKAARGARHSGPRSPASSPAPRRAKR